MALLRIGKKLPLRNVLIALWASLIVLHILSVAYPNALFAPWFDVDNERNVPTLVNGSLWLVAGIASLLHGLRSRRHKSLVRWSLLGALFAYIAVDELFVLHERVAEPLRTLLGIGEGSLFYHAWIIIATIVIGALLFIYFVIRDRKAIGALEKLMCKYLLIVGSGVVLLEAIGTQIYLSRVAYKLGPVLLEESFEIAMASLIAYTLVTHLKKPLVKRR